MNFVVSCREDVKRVASIQAKRPVWAPFRDLPVLIDPDIPTDQVWLVSGSSVLSREAIGEVL